MEEHEGGGVEEMRIWPVPGGDGAAGGGAAAFLPSAPVYLDVLAQQHANETLRAMVLSALGNMAGTGVAGAAGGFVDAIDTTSAHSAAAAGPPQLQGLPGANKETSLADLADFAAAQFRLDEQKLVQDVGGVVKKGSRKSKQPVMQAVDVAENASAADDDSNGDEHGSKAITEAMLGEMYHDITNQPIKHRECFKTVLRKYAKKYGVSQTSLRNIMSFKNRRADSCKFWNDDLWELYNKEVRCEICRGQFAKGSRVLCPHFARGRPSATQERHEVVAARFRHSSAAAGKEGKARERNNGLQRAYNVQILLPAVWACLGCPESKKFLQKKCAAHAT